MLVLVPLRPRPTAPNEPPCPEARPEEEERSLHTTRSTKIPVDKWKKESWKVPQCNNNLMWGEMMIG